MNPKTLYAPNVAAKQLKDAQWQRILAAFRHPDAKIVKVDEAAERKKHGVAGKS